MIEKAGKRLAWNILIPEAKQSEDQHEMKRRTKYIPYTIKRTIIYHESY